MVTLTCDCVAGTTVYMTQETDSPFWMLIMMALHYPSQHLTPHRTPQGKNIKIRLLIIYHIGIRPKFFKIDLLYFYL